MSYLVRISVAHPYFKRLKRLATKQVVEGLAVHIGILHTAVKVVQLGTPPRRANLFLSRRGETSAVVANHHQRQSRSNTANHSGERRPQAPIQATLECKSR
jgi:hypothetical protein